MTKKTLVVMLIAGIAAYLLVVLMGSSKVSSLLDLSLLQGFSIIIGLVIGAVGVLMGGLGSLYNLLVTATVKDDSLTSSDGKKISEAIESFQGLINEIKDDAIFLLFLFFLSFFIPLARVMNVPGAVWPFQQNYLSKEVVLSATAITLIFLAFYVIYDVLKAMFKIHEHYSILIQEYYKRRFKS